MKRKHFPKYNLQLSIWRNKTHISPKTIVHKKGEEITFIEYPLWNQELCQECQMHDVVQLAQTPFHFHPYNNPRRHPFTAFQTHFSSQSHTSPGFSSRYNSASSTFALWHTWKSVTFARHTETNSRVFWSIQIKLDEKMYICIYKILL